MAKRVKKKASLPLLFVDTNIYLNAYRARGESGILKHIEAVSDSLIVTDQVEIEFLNNRRNIINQTLKAIAAPPAVQVPSYLIASRAANSINRLHKQISKQVTTLTNRFEGFLNNSAKKDPALKIVRRLMAKQSFSLKSASKEVQKEVIELAFIRYHRNFPPRKPKDHGIGDAINWEWVLYCASLAKRDVIIVTEDGDFACEKGLLDWLAEEFENKTKQTARLIPRLSEALRLFEVKVTPAEEKEEALITELTASDIPWGNIVMSLGSLKNKFTWDRARQLSKMPLYWIELLKRMYANHPEATVCLADANDVTEINNVVKINFPTQYNHYLELFEGTKNKEIIEGILAEIGKPNRTVKFGITPDTETLVSQVGLPEL
jgi:hypothetical protein